MAPKADFDQWVRNWIADEKAKGRKCFDVKKSGNSYYVYFQTTRYNAELKKREKVSGYLGKLVEGIGLVEPDTYSSDDDENVTPARYGLGIDTGGTFTDAVIVDLDDYSVVAKRKSPTTHDDISKGLFSSVRAVFEASDITPKDISLVGISTTLATNSVLEGHGGQVGLILIGWEPDEGVSFGEKACVTIRGGFDSKGRAVHAMSDAEAKAAVEKVSKGVDAIAVSGFFAVANPSQEKRLKEIAKETTDLPVITGHELSAALGIDMRAETAVLNGKLIPIVSKFFDNVEKTFRKMGVEAPIMAYKGDGSVMSLDEARTYPVETILSGPAASAVGGRVLSGLDDCVIVDIGGTSTDIAVMDEGFPQIQYEGAAIGGWRTRVKAVDMYTVALGGDSRISLNDRKFTIGPDRVVPISTLTVDHPEIVPKMMHNEIYDYYTANDVSTRDMTDKERRIYESVRGKGPLDVMAVMNATEGLWIIDAELRSLTRMGALTAASITPTDVMVYLGKFESGNREGAEAAVYAMAESQGMETMQLARLLFEEIKMKVSEAVMTKLLNDDMGSWEEDGAKRLVRKMTSLSRNRTVDLLPKLNVPIVGIGAPAAHMMEDIGERFGTKAVFSENFDVGNAIGAVSSKISESLVAIIQPTVDNRYTAAIPFMGTTYYSHRDTAIAAAKKCLEDYLSTKVRRSGGTNVKTLSRARTYYSSEGRYGGWDELATTINFIEVTSRAVGDPPQRT